ncbi:MAG: hypothetical protein V1645_01495 [archaeon]
MKVVIGSKVDMDTTGVGFLLNVKRSDFVKVVQENADDAYLKNPEILCIECGGSGQGRLLNFDHHDPLGPQDSATKQAYNRLTSSNVPMNPWYTEVMHKYSEEKMKQFNFIVRRLVDYINHFETKGFQSLPNYGRLKFPLLSDVFSGMLLLTNEPLEQFHTGIDIFWKIVDTLQDSYFTIDGFPAYAAAKAEQNQKVLKAVKSAGWTRTKSGLKLAFLQSELYGVVGSLYGVGADVVVVFNPNFNGVPKFTVAGREKKVTDALDELNSLEKGWGGPTSETIIGSKSGTKLDLMKVVEIVSKSL